MKTNHSPEIAVLLMACALELSEARREQLTQFLNQHPLNWSRLYTLAGRHKVLPFLYRTLQGIPNVSESFLATLQNGCRAIATDNLLKLHQYKHLAKRLSDNAIAHIAFKGVYLAANCYPDSSLRSIGDMDVLVAKEDVFKSIRLLESDGYQLDQKSQLYMQYDAPVMLSDVFELSLIKPFFNNSYFDLDLHWEVMCFNRHYKSFTLQELLDKPALFTEVQIILLVTHHGIVNIWQTINYINDLYFLLKGKPINWSWLVEELRQNGLEQVFFVGLYWCQEIWGLALPQFIEEILAAENVKSLAIAYERNWEATESLPESKLTLGQLTFFLKAQTQLSKKLKIVFTFWSSRVFIPSRFRIGKRVLYIPRQLGLITFFIRGIRSLLRFIPALQKPLH
ncbi:hypothetical protein GO730_27785 [Spirosoma sp. HMF3257]|uniref:Nucleotidyltransferase family protein n=1 Tax=Spirosoma telluris TaxID=2183553 RepID=A0A327NPD0_9BACT|nr:hypothetical protein [Spirosoma telluris]RAI77027.1 hypothetical protein HMF3257_27720 [Spirosoma telluris]